MIILKFAGQPFRIGCGVDSVPIGLDHSDGLVPPLKNMPMQKVKIQGSGLGKRRLDNSMEFPLPFKCQN